MDELAFARKGRKRIRSEECEVLKVASLRSCVEPLQERVVLADGTELDLHRAEVRGTFAQRGTRGTASTLIAHCPSCSRVVRVLRKPYGAQKWGCRGCLPLIYPAQRRSGWHKGRANRKPSTWKLDAIRDEQQQIAAYLRLETWPPNTIAWGHSELNATRRLKNSRREALMDRLAALESLRISILASWLSSRFGIEISSNSGNYLENAENNIKTTKWAKQENWRRKRPQSPQGKDLITSIRSAELPSCEKTNKQDHKDLNHKQIKGQSRAN